MKQQPIPTNPTQKRKSNRKSKHSNRASVQPPNPSSILEQQRQHLPLAKKIQIYMSSFLAFTSIHALRTTYSFSKSFLPQQIMINDSLIGIADSVMLLFVGLGNFLIAVKPLSKPIRSLWIALTLCALQYCLVPISMNILTGSLAFTILVILMGVNGFLQSFAWPNLLPLVHSAYSPDKDTTLLGFWATCANFGNLIGFITCQYVVLNNGYSWQVGMYIVAVYMLLNALYIALRIDQMPNQPTQVQSQSQQQNQSTQQSKIRQPLLNQSRSSVNTNFKQLKQQQRQQQLKKRKEQAVSILYSAPSEDYGEYPSVIDVFRNSPRVTLLTISFSLLKSVMYGILLWLPVYFYTIGLVDQSLYIPMTFDGASVVGSIILGFIFKKLSPSKKNLVLIPMLILLLIFFLMLKIIDFSVKGYFIVIGLVGVCLGGSYNTMAGLVTMQLVRTVPAQLQTKYLRFYSALLMAIANVITAITQIIIGFTISKSEGALFGFFVTYTSINLCSMLGVVLIEFYTIEDPQKVAQKKKKKKEQQRKIIKQKQPQQKDQKPSIPPNNVYPVYKQIEIFDINNQISSEHKIQINQSNPNPL